MGRSEEWLKTTRTLRSAPATLNARRNPPCPIPATVPPSICPHARSVPQAAPDHRPPPPLPPRIPDAAASILRTPEPDPEVGEVEDGDGDGDVPRRRVARRRPAGPSRNRIAANDDGPSIGGLIFALQQKPSNAVFKYAAIGSVDLVRHRRGLRPRHARLGCPRPRLVRPAVAPRHLLHRDRGRRAHRGSVAACAAVLARRGAAAQVVHHDRGGHPAGRARPRRRAADRLAGSGRAPAGLLHERRHFARARTRGRARGARAQRGDAARTLV